MKTLFALLACLALSSCAMFRNPYSGEVDTAKIIRFIEPASYFACKAVIKKTEDATTRRKMATVIFRVAGGVRQLAGGTVPSAEEIENMVLSITPGEVHWAEMAYDLGVVYENFYDNVTESQRVDLLFAALGELAEGCERAAKPYVSPGEWDRYVETNIIPFNTEEMMVSSGMRRFVGRARPD